MSIFKIREEIVNSSGNNFLKSRVFLCDSAGEPIEDYYANFLADRVIVRSADVKTATYKSELHGFQQYRSYECNDISVEEDEKGTTVIFS